MAVISGDLALNLPPKLDELIHAVRTGEVTDEGLKPLSYQFAESVEAVHRCDEEGCGRTIVEADVLAELLAEHYRASAEERGDLADALRESKLETGDTLMPNYCSYHRPLTSATS